MLVAHIKIPTKNGIDRAFTVKVVMLEITKSWKKYSQQPRKYWKQ